MNYKQIYWLQIFTNGIIPLVAQLFLYTDPKHHKYVHSLPVSHFYIDSDESLESLQEKTKFLDQFNFIGANLIGNSSTVKTANEFIEETGGLKKLQDWSFKLAKDVGDAAAQLWGTRVWENQEGTSVSSLVSVEFPIAEGVTIVDWETFNIYKFVRESNIKKVNQRRENHCSYLL